MGLPSRAKIQQAFSTVLFRNLKEQELLRTNGMSSRKASKKNIFNQSILEPWELYYQTTTPY